jgi:NAD(P)H-hydrate epimerase
MMLDEGYSVMVCALSPPEKMSESSRTNFSRLQDMGKSTPVVAPDSKSFPAISKDDIVIDAILGNGLTRPAEGIAYDGIHHINTSGATVVSIDVPSGLFCDTTSQNTPLHLIVRADYTLTFSPPKLAFFFPENDAFVGNWQLLDIGLSQVFLDSAKVKYFMTVADDVAPLLKRRNKFAHKGTFGHALIIAGSAGKMGAAVLAAKACLRSGPGLVTVHMPKSGISILQTAVPEAMLSIDPDDDIYSVAPDLTPYSSVAIGPGIGTSEKTANALKILIQHATTPIIFDADAINILAENKTWLGFIPEGSVFTPHPKEFERLAGKSSNNFERNRMQIDFSFRHQCYVVLKGANTAITTPDGRCFFNTTGNPGMATGGSGDVLTGIIAGFMAQGYTSFESCLLGVYLHGSAGDIASGEQGMESLIAGDIVLSLGKSFQTLYGKL